MLVFNTIVKAEGRVEAEINRASIDLIRNQCVVIELCFITCMYLCIVVE